MRTRALRLTGSVPERGAAAVHAQVLEREPLRPDRRLTRPGGEASMSTLTAIELEADYLVVGAGATGMAFTDALVDHADVRVIMVDRRHAPGGHWLDAYPFVQLHQASSFYGVASTLLGDGAIQQGGREAGLHERATATEICGCYNRVLRERLLASGRVAFYHRCDYRGDNRFVSHHSGQQYEVPGPPTRSPCSRSRRVAEPGGGFTDASATGCSPPRLSPWRGCGGR
jgi:hypothetical protein